MNEPSMFERYSIGVHRLPLLGEVLDASRTREHPATDWRGPPSTRPGTGPGARQTRKVHGVRVHVFSRRREPLHGHVWESARTYIAPVMLKKLEVK